MRDDAAPPVGSPSSGQPLDDAEFRLLADNLPTLCWIADASGYIVWYNRRWHEYCGTTPAEMEGWGWQSVHDPAVLPAVMERWTASIATGEPFEMTFPLRGADGMFRPFLTRVNPVLGEDGAILRWVGTNIEVAEQVAAQDALRHERDRSRDVLENMGEGFIVLDPEFRVVEINREGERIDGRPRAELIGRHILDLWPETASLPNWPMFQRVMATRQPDSVEYRHKSDVHDVWLEVRAYPVEAGLAAFYRDVTGRRQAEEASRESEGRFRALASAITKVFYINDLARQKLTYVSPAYETIWEQPVEALYANPTAFMEAVHPDDRPVVLAAMERQHRGEGTEVEYRLRIGDRIKWVSDRAFHTVDPVTGAAQIIGVAEDITARRASEQTIRDTEERLRLATRATNDAIWDWSFEKNRVLWNEALADAFGHRPADGTTDASWWLEQIHPDDRDRIGTSIHAVIDGGGTNWTDEYRFRRADGSYADVLDRGAVIRDGEGRATRMIGAMLDLSERKRTEAALREREERLRLVVDGAADYAIMTVDPERRITSWSKGAERAFGWTEAEALGRSSDLLFTDEDRAAGEPQREVDTAAREGVAADVRLHRRADGSLVFMNGTVRLLPRDEAGRERGFIKIARDETDRLEAEEQLRETQRRLDAVLNNTSMAIFLMDHRQHCVYANPAAERLTGYRFEEMQNRPLHDVVHHKYPDGRDYPLHECPIDRAFPERANMTGQELFVAPDGSFYPVAFTASPVLDDNGKPIGTVVEARNISDELAQEEALKEKNAVIRAFYETSNLYTAVLQLEPEDFCFVAANRETNRFYDVEDLTGRKGSEFMPPELMPRLAGALRSAHEGHKPVTLEYPFKTGRQTRWYLSTLAPMPPSASGKPRVSVASFDITDRKRAERALKASEERLEAITDSVDQMIWSTRPDGYHDYYNRRWYEFTGMPPGTTDGEEWNGMFHPDDQERAWARWQHCLRTGEPYEIEYRLRHNSGQYRWVIGRARAVRDAEGRIGRWYGTCTDVHDLKVAEEALLAESRTLETLNRTGAALAGELNQERLVQMVTDAGVSLTGADYGAFFYSSDDANDFALYTLSGARREDFEKFGRPRVTDIFHGTFVAGQVIRSDDIQADPAYGKMAPHHGVPEGHLPVRSYLAVPVLARSGEVIGALLFAHAEPGRFTERHERTIVGLAAQAAIAVDNARLVERMQREVADRTRAQDELSRLNATLEERVAERTADRDRMWRLSTDLMLVSQFDSTITAINPAWTRLLGWMPDELVGTSFLDLVHPDDLAATQAEAARLADGLTTLRFENRYRAKDGSYRWLSWTAVPDEAFVHAAARDIEAEKRAEAELATAQDALRQAQKMEAVGQLTGGIAHDFNNLLTVVMGNIDMGRRALDAEGDSTARIRRALDNAQRGAERAAALTQRLLAFARRQPLMPKPINVDRLVTGMSDLLQRALGETVQLEVVTAPGLWRVEADPNQLESAILNLAVNARDAMPRGGKLSVETANANLQDSYSAQHAEVAPGQYVVIAVSDTGEGMSRETMAHVFEPFFTTKEVGKGTGLGLSQVYGFVKQSGGHVKLYSELGHGTTVKIYLPRMLGEIEADEEAEAGDAELAHARETVLVVEDDADVRAYSAESLRELGYRVLEAEDGPAALRVLERAAGPVDLLFTDVVMPGMSGRELADAARALRPDLKVLFTSGYTRNAITRDGRLEPGTAMIAKPFSFPALARKLRDVLDMGKSGRVLLVSPAPTAIADALGQDGVAVDGAGNAREAIDRVRAGTGLFDAVLIDGAGSARAALSLYGQLRALREDLPILLIADGVSAAGAARLEADRCAGLLPLGTPPETLADALAQVGVTCAEAHRQANGG